MQQQTETTLEEKKKSTVGGILSVAFCPDAGSVYQQSWSQGLLLRRTRRFLP